MLAPMIKQRSRVVETNSFARIIGLLISGFGTKAIAAGLAIWVAMEVYSFFTAALAPITAALG